MTAGATGADLEEILRAALDAAFECGRCSDADKGAAIDAIVQVVRGHFDALDRPAPDPTAPVGSEELTGAVDAEGLDGILDELDADRILRTPEILHSMNGLMYLIKALFEFGSAGMQAEVRKIKKLHDDIVARKNRGRPPKWSRDDWIELGRQIYELKIDGDCTATACQKIAARGIWKAADGVTSLTHDDIARNHANKALRAYYEADRAAEEDAFEPRFDHDMVRSRIRFHWGI